jgi:hypothetical protein
MSEAFVSRRWNWREVNKINFYYENIDPILVWIERCSTNTISDLSFIAKYRILMGEHPPTIWISIKGT